MNRTTVVTSTSPQIGSYFGFTVTSMDVNDDGFDDLLVGAPLYSHLRVGSFDEGSVTIFFGEATFIPNLVSNLGNLIDDFCRCCRAYISVRYSIIALDSNTIRKYGPRNA